MILSLPPGIPTRVELVDVEGVDSEEGGGGGTHVLRRADVQHCSPRVGENRNGFKQVVLPCEPVERLRSVKVVGLRIR